MTRSELYSLVWQHPSIHVARQLGVSTARLRKICQDHEIPLPPAGYWTKLAYGKPVDQPPLPLPTPTFLNKINSALRRFGEVPLQFADQQISAFDLDFDVADSNDAPRSLALPANLAEVLATSLPDEHGFVSVNDPTLPSVYIGVESIDRVLAFLDAFIGFLLGRGYQVSHAAEEFRIVAAGEPLALKLYETRLREPLSPPGGMAEPRYRPSGKLCMELYDPRPLRWSHRNVVGQWHDRQGRPLERCFDDALTAIMAAVGVIKHCRARAVQHAGELAAAREHTRDLERREEIERRRTEYLKGKARAFADYEQLMRLAAFLSNTALDAPASPVNRLRDHLDKLIASMRGQFEADSLRADILRLQLFDADD